jgi:tryptophanyl-tRNA synthetase
MQNIRILSGVQPTGSLHLGNYLGAIKQFARLAREDAECFFCVVDLHAITQKHDPAALRHNTLRVAAAYLAAGVSTTRSNIFIQSRIPEHASLAWLLQCVARTGWLDRMTQFREKTGGANQDLDRVVRTLRKMLNDREGGVIIPNCERVIREDELLILLDAVSEQRSHREKASVGLYTYPVLQAADILLYGATHVPVGDDQRQHIHLAADIAKKFNHDYQPVFVEPEPMVPPVGARIMSLRDGLSKMSKSDEDDNSRINLDDSDDVIARKIKRATAHTNPMPDNLSDVNAIPTVRNLVTIYAALSDRHAAAVVQEFAGKGWGVFKPALADLVIEKVGPIRDEMQRLLGDLVGLRDHLGRGQHRAQETATQQYIAAKEVMGFV